MALEVICPRCGRDNHWSNHCWMCGQSLDGVAPRECRHPDLKEKPTAGRVGWTILNLVLCLAAIVLFFPVLLVVTCFGVSFLGRLR
jgi:hypothetical protein